MATEILMPALSPTMTEGKLARWLKAEGDAITAGDVIAEIETDKATMEVEAVEEGVLGRIVVPDGTENVAVNAPIAILVEPGEAVPDTVSSPTLASKEPAVPAQSGTMATSTSAAPASASAPPPRHNSSPLARRIAAEKGVDLANVRGTGPNGRILRRDVEQAKPAAPAAARPAAPQSAPVSAGGVTRVPNSTMRKVIARRLSESKQTVPHFYVSVDIELDALLALRQRLNGASPSEGDGQFKLSVNDMLIKAAALALRQVPKVNARYTEAETLLFDDIDISVAVSVADGLITPIVTKADTKSLREISAEARDLIKRARAGKLLPHEFQGGTFSISNMGMFGVSSFAAIVNPPQAAILAIAAGEKRAVVKGDQLAIATVMTATLSVDHRVVDGALGAEWMAAFREIVENPYRLVV
ncbi:pyruvate dehydrogenase complex dihydrolipoamide acetyltransferase [Tanticharoenia sakaeratensis]|uniref:Acetyltransferase component of pyruvate dehydrogenase complex n=1 Tax=Tanticharoenia sakaeratensis NBRC 103193 TaxID=1231623 RepID=A0A0D6MIP6_9PROT|nr:pyruvate dehydrogenase complex dihydrolipoamide acetyltransferase [Tanticharoenia sakaeratensis]GAN53356.1 dihydrolipoyllysine-residue acetyltransferase component of pyruvate dehydrogenase complex [Tanticharoenia sakaeratensis NBRC 103193]GBQ20882.1 dihydrolipoamide acetyltransferase component [Tanticharoenia sakaeratensis NBRC 103193]